MKASWLMPFNGIVCVQFEIHGLICCVDVIQKLKGEVVPLHPMKACRGSGCLAPSILNLGTRWR